MLKPLRGEVLIELDPIPSPSKALYAPDEDYIKICKRCNKMMEALEQPCWPKEEWSYDSKTGRRPVLKEIHYAHDIVAAKAPARPPRTRTGKVIAANNTPDIRVGMRVMIDTAAGRDPFDEAKHFERQEETQLRLVRSEAILAEIE
jgi:hypothetical protein